VLRRAACNLNRFEPIDEALISRDGSLPALDLHSQPTVELRSSNPLNKADLLPQHHIASLWPTCSLCSALLS
jgi:hypothetical protein